MFMVIAALGTVFAAGYLLWLFQRTAFGDVPTESTVGGHGLPTPSAPRVNDEHHELRRSHDVNVYRVDRLDAAARR